MNDHPVIRAFPDRPIALAPDRAGTRRRRLQLIGVVLLFVPLIWFGYSTLHARALRADLKARGVQAEMVSAEGSCLSRRNITGNTPSGCNLDIRYRTQEGGAERTAKVYLPGAAPLVFAPSVLYDPQDPSRVMTRADVDRGDPFMNLAVPLAAFTIIPILALLIWLATGNGRLKQAAAAPRPGIVPIQRATRDKRNRLEVFFPNPAGGPDGRALFASGGPLLVTPPAGETDGRQWALALLTAKGWPLLLDQDLARLDLTPDERETILRAARS